MGDRGQQQQRDGDAACASTLPGSARLPAQVRQLPAQCGGRRLPRLQGGARSTCSSAAGGERGEHHAHGPGRDSRVAHAGDSGTAAGADGGANRASCERHSCRCAGPAPDSAAAPGSLQYPALVVGRAVHDPARQLRQPRFGVPLRQSARNRTPARLRRAPGIHAPAGVRRAHRLSRRPDAANRLRGTGAATASSSRPADGPPRARFSARQLGQRVVAERFRIHQRARLE